MRPGGMLAVLLTGQFMVFVRRQRRVTSPLLDLGVLARPGVAWTLGALGAATSTFLALLFVLALHLQRGLGHSALFSGLVLVLASVYATAGLARPDGTALALLLGFGGLGLGLGFAPQLARVTASVPARYAADLSGLVNTNFQLAGVTGVAAFGALYLGVPGSHGHTFRVVMAAFAGQRAAGRARSREEAGAAGGGDGL
ncbi:MAG: hypothetical protein ACRDNL_11165 [Spirillospora sp.]